ARYREFCRANEVDDERCGRMTTQWEKVRSDTAAKERRRYLAAQRAKKKDCNWTCRLKRGAGGALGDFDAFAEGFTETFAEVGEAAVDRAKFLAQCVPGYGSAEGCLAVAQEAVQHLERATGPGGPTAAVLAPVHQVVVETVRPVVEDLRKGHYSKAAGRVTANVVMAAGPGAIAKAGIAAKAARAPQTALRGGAGPVRVGQQGLDALGVTQNTSRIALGGGRYRVPDILDEAGGVIGEVKNVQSLSYSAQLRDYVGYAQANQLQFDLYVRGSTRLSGPLQRAVAAGDINLWRWLPR
ncbi:MAG: putative toxin, partial [Chloroflexota bacterium]|nr:putative toxin [Chloroflexota bacterium]